MMFTLYFLLGTFGCFFLFWVLWLAVCALSAANDAKRLSPLMTMLGTGFVYCALVYDVLINVTLCSLLFLEIPRETTLSQRLRRLVKTTGWRKAVAVWISVHLVNPFADTPHIKFEVKL